MREPPRPRRRASAALTEVDDQLPYLLARYGEELAIHLRRLVRDDDIAQDLFQETMLRAHSAIGRVRQAANARAWLYRIATNVFLNHARSKARELKALRRHAEEAETTVPAEADGRQDELAGRKTALWTRVAALPEKQRLAVALRVGEGLRYDEIARRMGCTAAAARANVYQAIRKLRWEGR